MHEKIIIKEVTQLQHAVPLSCLTISLTVSCKERQPRSIFTAGELKHLMSHVCVENVFPTHCFNTPQIHLSLPREKNKNK